MKDVTLLIAAYNQGHFLEEALSSALNQDFPADRLEVIVIDDGSTDSTAEVLEGYRARARVLHQHNQGLTATCNRGLAEASGRFFIRLDSDDVADPRLVSRLFSELDRDPGSVLAYSDRFEFSERERRRVECAPNDLYAMVACGALMRTSELREVGGYRRVFWEEYDLFLRLAGKGRFAHVAEPLYRYRFHGNNMTGDAGRRLEGWRELAGLHGSDQLKACGDVSRFKELTEVLGQ